MPAIRTSNLAIPTAFLLLLLAPAGPTAQESGSSQATDAAVAELAAIAEPAPVEAPAVIEAAPEAAPEPASAEVAATPAVTAAEPDTVATDAAASAPGAAGPDAAGPDDPVAELFVGKCASCHTVGKGPRVGPDLANVHQRRERAWIERFVGAPSTMLDSDGEARKLVAEFKGVRMPDLGLTAEQVTSLVDLVVRCSSEPCNLVGSFVAVTTATPDDAARGRAIFLGHEALKGGGVACVSCHTVTGTGTSIPGGTLAKDLTNAFARLGDEGLDAALKSPSFPLMNKVFADHPIEKDEAFALRAFLYDRNRAEVTHDEVWSVALAGTLGAGLVMVVLNGFWSRRLRGVRGSVKRRKGNRS